MGLPVELLHYAENFYRRFPDEFVALGAPGLEELFDLRPTGGTLTRKISETPSERTVEITIRRWHMPSWPPPSALHHHHLPGAFAAGYPAPSHHPVAAAAASSFSSAAAEQHQLSAAAAMAAAEEQVSGRLARLEAAVQSVQPQIEALLVQMRPSGATGGQQLLQQWRSPQQQQPSTLQQQVGTQPSLQQRSPQQSLQPGTAGNVQTDGLIAVKHNEEPNKLQARRQMSPLQIQTTPVGTDVSKLGAVVKVPDGNSKLEDAAANHDGKDVRDSAEEKEAKTGDRQRPSVSVVPTRIQPSKEDPHSPRSPGRFSVWKSN
jgi:hypothetical protein